MSIKDHTKAWQRGGPAAARVCRAWPRQIATPLGTRLADGPLRRLFRIHVDGVFRLAAGARGRREPSRPSHSCSRACKLLRRIAIADLHAALYSAGGVLAAAFPADLFIRAPRWLNGRTFLMPQFMLRWPARINGWTRLLIASRRGRVPESGRIRGVGTAITGIGRPIAVTLTPSRRIRQTL